MMLTIGVGFVIWNVVVAQSVSRARALAIPASVVVVVAGVFLATVPFSSVTGLGSASFLTHEAALFVSAGLGLFALVVFLS